jgi:hypothetical protein
MAYFKIVRKTLEINGSSRSTSIDLRAEVFSYDKNVSKFLFELTSKEAEIDLTGATVRVLLTYVGNDGKKGIIEDNGGVEANTINQIYYLLPEELRGYDGTVVMGLYVDLPSGEAIDIQNVQFRMFKSSIDDGAGVAGVIYFKSFEEWLFQVKEKALLEIQNIDEESERITKYADTKIKEYDEKFVQSNQKMSELQQSQIELSDQLDETNKKIDEADVYRKDEVFNKPESSANVIYQLIGKEKVRLTFILDAKNKIAGSDTENPNCITRAVRTAKPIPPTGAELTNGTGWDAYEKVSTLDGTVLELATGNDYPFMLFDYDVLEVVKRELGENFFTSQGATSQIEQVNILRRVTNTVTTNSTIWGHGSSVNGNRIYHQLFNRFNSQWQYSQSNTASGITPLNIPVPAGNMQAHIMDDGHVHGMTYTDAAADGTMAKIRIDYARLEFSIEISAYEYFTSVIAANQVESIATGEEAEAGESNSVFMTPNLVFKAIAKWVQGKFVSTAGNETILGTKNFQDGIQVKGKLPVLTKSVNDYASVDKNNNASVISDGSMKLYRRGDIVYLTGSFKLSAAKYNQAVWFNVPSWAAPIDRPRMYWSSGSNFYLLAFDPSTINNIICIDNVAQDTWLTGSFCWLARDPY